MVKLLNEDWSIITELNNREDGKANKHELGELRIVFARIKDNFGVFSYRYIGNFKLTEVSNDNNLRIFEKISDNLYIDYDKEKIEVQSI